MDYAKTVGRCRDHAWHWQKGKQKHRQQQRQQKQQKQQVSSSSSRSSSSSGNSSGNSAARAKVPDMGLFCVAALGFLVMMSLEQHRPWHHRNMDGPAITQATGGFMSTGHQ